MGTILVLLIGGALATSLGIYFIYDMKKKGRW